MYRIGIDLGGTKTEIIVLDDSGRECLRRRVPTPRGDYPGTLDMLVSLVREAESELGAEATVGVGTPGAVSARTGRMKNCNSVWLNDRPLREDLEARLERPVRIANDANCLALSEATDGAGAGAAVVFAVILGTGTGAGIAVNGRVITGANAIAGEWGHNPLPWSRDEERPGPRCYCGRRGCLETWLSGPGLVADHVQAGGEALDARTLAARAAQGDPACVASLQRHQDRLARGLAHVVNLLDPDVIVLAGGLSALPDLCVGVSAQWGEFIFSDHVDTRIVPARHGDSSGVRGAAWLWA
ncbi:fructokinase [Thioalkalivibrio denitrificans]|uniref:Fructokinase n=1 Tax=Thioalkalivibrio denitrificans TaxID=108003 RepID=A0A1V3NFY7_9GAMM|nr:ROK family protein [Thioalkalivibrio denitrificans]OOG23788.1 fructokinase [Thioalkalivibrio denitrificans]